MRTPVYKLNNNSRLREFLPISVKPSFKWLLIKFLISFLFLNLGVIALVPYWVPIEISISWLLWLLLNLLLIKWVIAKNHLTHFCGHLSYRNGIWILENSSRQLFCNLDSAIIVWSWIIIIPLYSPAINAKFTLVLLRDSFNPQDNASLRRWIHSEFS